MARMDVHARREYLKVVRESYLQARSRAEGTLLAYLIGVSILRGKHTESSWGEVLSTMGFTNSPGFLRILAFIPVVGGVIAFLASIWALIAAVIGITAAPDFSTWRAVLTTLVGRLACTALVFVLSALFGGYRSLADCRCPFTCCLRSLVR